MTREIFARSPIRITADYTYSKPFRTPLRPSTFYPSFLSYGEHQTGGERLWTVQPTSTHFPRTALLFRPSCKRKSCAYLLRCRANLTKKTSLTKGWRILKNNTCTTWFLVAGSWIFLVKSPNQCAVNIETIVFWMKLNISWFGALLGLILSTHTFGIASHTPIMNESSIIFQFMPINNLVTNSIEFRLNCKRNRKRNEFVRRKKQRRRLQPRSVRYEPWHCWKSLKRHLEESSKFGCFSFFSVSLVHRKSSEEKKRQRGKERWSGLCGLSGVCHV